jgi:hypothetical protein
MNLLIKFPTRERKEKFFSVLDNYINLASNIKKLGFIITLDLDDITMNNDQVKEKFESYKKNGIKLAYHYENNKTKIQAVNANINYILGWDILLLASDDMIPIEKGYDEIIRKDMTKNFPDTDGVLWYNDGGQNRINTLCILGKRYFDRFGYIYHPEYNSLWCDNEFTEVSLSLNRVYKSDKVIIEHAHPVYNKSSYDYLYIRNENYKDIDRLIYEKRKAKNYL